MHIVLYTIKLKPSIYFFCAFAIIIVSDVFVTLFDWLDNKLSWIDLNSTASNNYYGSNPLLLLLLLFVFIIIIITIIIFFFIFSALVNIVGIQSNWILLSMKISHRSEKSKLQNLFLNAELIGEFPL